MKELQSLIEKVIKKAGMTKFRKKLAEADANWEPTMVPTEPKPITVRKGGGATNTDVKKGVQGAYTDMMPDESADYEAGLIQKKILDELKRKKREEEEELESVR